MSGLDYVRALLEQAGKRGRASSGGWAYQCPAHEDRKASLMVHEREGRVLLKCHAGCSFEQITEALGADPVQLAPEEDPRRRGREKPVAVYPYVDEDGVLLFEVVRFPNKEFRQRRPKPGGGHVWNLEGTRRVLYRLPKLLEALEAGNPVWIVEGEKDVETLERYGFVATTNPGGAGKWRSDEYGPLLMTADVVIAGDADEPGRAHIEHVSRSLVPFARTIRIVGDYAGAKDVSELVMRAEAAGSDAETVRGMLEALADVDPWTPAVRLSTLLLEPPSSNGDGPVWPKLGEEALGGLAGDVVRFLAPHTEADPAGILVSFLAQFGALVGPGPHIRLSGASHPSRLFAVIVGDSASRKGAAHSMVRWLMAEAAPVVVAERWKKGLSSAEGLLELVKDTRRNGKGDVVEEGVADKRLFVFESELTAVLERMRRQGNTLSQTLRDAWDTGDLQTITRQAPLVATGAHVCILANATPEELEEKIGRIDVTNGFVNRFLFAAVKAGPPLPLGSEPDTGAFHSCAQEIVGVVEQARLRRRMQFDDEVRATWPEHYCRIRTEIPPGVLGHYVARADVHILRLALIYALLDGEEMIGWAHVRRGMALWDYCRGSVEYMIASAPSVDTGVGPDVVQLVELLLEQGDMTARDAAKILRWNGARLAATRARAERMRLLELLPGLPGPQGGRPSVVMRVRS